MKVSIITATYNSSKTIVDAIDSVNTQNYNSIYHVFKDGKSSDATVKLINVNATRNPIVISEADNGLYDAINKSINIANGDVIGFLHSDDIFASKSVISEIIEKIRLENLDGVYGNLNYVHHNDTSKIIRRWKSADFNPKLLNLGWMPAHPTLFLKKEVYQKHGNFDLKYNISADYDFMLRVLKDESLKFGYLPNVITNMRVGGASNRSLRNIIIKSIEDYKIIKSHNLNGLLTLLLKNLSKIPQFFKI